MLSRFRFSLTDLIVEDRPGFKRIDASAARYDDGAWLNAPAATRRSER